ncbi:3-phosphoshikimate 1-carboxyvinyltransferase [Methanospirillum stamsii]|uniref:3-phosphoshikimate 1-carboxyvinyltransferase n=1 Tax=Methanospirillum stamsii TaxID=1277351 RepID=A0A2V2NEA9_9EURY|nr:3-phosphoshikimate 1-carboxyvinyltransferase [Methanospirillum stamsii]PWR74758.1 3-phosphoshikimate 1-carboxyvinyltransferase [Methanospirillum stamsii]
MQMNIGRCGKVSISCVAPASKSYTHRALIIAALADGESEIIGQLDADDTRMTARALMNLGVRLEWCRECIRVRGMGGHLTAPADDIDIQDSGTSMRLLTALSLLADGPVTLTGSKRMQERPLGPLIDALNAVGGNIRYLKKPGCPPVSIDGTFSGGDITIDGSISSQFISSLLIAAPYAAENTRIHLLGEPVSLPYIMMTIDSMQAFGAEVFVDDGLDGETIFSVSTNHHYQERRYTIEGDFSSASYWFALAAICGGFATVSGLNSHSAQGDRRLLDILRNIGCSITDNEDGITLTRDRNIPLRGIEVNMADCPDVVQTVCMVAAVADSPTRITGVHHLRMKESDRIAAIANGLTALGGNVSVEEDAITIHPTPLHGGVIHPENDHRTAMSFAVLGCYVGDVTILDAGCVTKSYPEFWEELRRIWQDAVSC